VTRSTNVVHGKGMKRSGRKGDLVLDVNLDLPKHLSKKAKEAFETLRSEGL
jgi:DnaJ-class molecular chaperone